MKSLVLLVVLMLLAEFGWGCVPEGRAVRLHLLLRKLISKILPPFIFQCEFSNWNNCCPGLKCKPTGPWDINLYNSCQR